MIKRLAYDMSVAEGIRRFKQQTVSDRFCRECGCTCILFPDQLKNWDGHCHVCRSWKRGLLAWICGMWGWELKRKPAAESDVPVNATLNTGPR